MSVLRYHPGWAPCTAAMSGHLDASERLRLGVQRCPGNQNTYGCTSLARVACAPRELPTVRTLLHHREHVHMTDSSSSIEHSGRRDSGNGLQPGPRQATSGGASLARFVTEVLAPAPTVAVLVLLIAWHSTPTVAEAVRWGALAALFVSVMPFLYIVRGASWGTD